MFMIFLSANGLQELNVPDDVLVTAQKNLFALKELLDTNPYLFHSAPGDHTGARSAVASEQEAWKVSCHASYAVMMSPTHTVTILGRAKLRISAAQSSRASYRSDLFHSAPQRPQAGRIDCTVSSRLRLVGQY